MSFFNFKGLYPKKGEYKMKDLFKAVKMGDANKVNHILETTDDVDIEVNFAGNTPLMWAVGAGNHEIVELLIKHGADVNARYTNSTTILTTAVLAGDAFSVKLLIENGVDIDAKDDAGFTALIWAINGNGDGIFSGSGNFNHSEEIVELLIKNGADVNAKDNQGWSAVNHAESQMVSLISIIRRIK